MQIENSIFIKQALIIDQPWVNKILAGEKIWEMRTVANGKQGWVGLIEKGTGRVVGIINLNGSQGPLSKNQLKQHFEKHQVGPEIVDREDYKWFHAWSITEARRLAVPVVYKHPNGAVIWVNLDDECKDAINKQVNGGDVDVIGESVLEHALLAKPVRMTLATTTHSSQTNHSISTVLTAGAIKNNYFRVPYDENFFPAAIWGGANKSEKGTQATFQFEGIDFPVQTDIDISKKILRLRSAIGGFYKLHNLAAGDQVVITKTAELSYSVGFTKRSQLCSQ